MSQLVGTLLFFGRLQGRNATEIHVPLRSAAIKNNTLCLSDREYESPLTLRQAGLLSAQYRMQVATHHHQLDLVYDHTALSLFFASVIMAEYNTLIGLQRQEREASTTCDGKRRAHGKVAGEGNVAALVVVSTMATDSGSTSRVVDGGSRVRCVQGVSVDLQPSPFPCNCA